MSDAAFADATWNNMFYSHQKYQRFALRHGLARAPHTDKMLMFGAWLECEGVKASSILTEVSNVKAALKTAGIPEAELKAPQLDICLKGLRKLASAERRNRAKPMTTRVLSALMTSDAPPRLKAISGLAWITASRLGDIRRLRVDDISFEGPQVVIQWRSRKDWRNNAMITTVQAGWLLPHIKEGLRGLSAGDELGDGRSTAYWARRLPEGYSGHSMRRGATQVACRTCTPEEVLALTLHASVRSLVLYAPRALATHQTKASAAIVASV